MVALAKSDEERELVLKNIFHAYLLKEIRQILVYRQDLELKNDYRLALQIGNNELSGPDSPKIQGIAQRLGYFSQPHACLLTPTRGWNLQKPQNSILQITGSVIEVIVLSNDRIFFHSRPINCLSRNVKQFSNCIQGQTMHVENASNLSFMCLALGVVQVNWYPYAFIYTFFCCKGNHF